MQITVVGTGYVGLVAGACFAELGLYVKCLDHDHNKIKLLNSGKIHIYEPGLEEIVAKNIKSNRLTFSTDKGCLVNADLVLIAVGTPAQEDGNANLTYLHQVVEDIAAFCPQGKPVMIKSTVPVGTAKIVSERFKNLNPNAFFEVISNPEFLREGSATEDFMDPERIIIGGSDKGHLIAKKIYASLIERNVPMLFTDNQTAELIKYTANCYLAMRLAFLNEVADVAEAVGADINHVADGIGMDSRIGRKYLNAGPGYGGSCFPKDTTALSHIAHNCGAPSKILDATIEANNGRKKLMVSKIFNALNEVDAAKKRCAIWGLTFKAGTDDVRDGPSLYIIPPLVDAGIEIVVYDPRGMDEAKKIFDDKIVYASSLYEAADGADLIVILTEWDEFYNLDMSLLSKSMNNPVILDLRNIFSLEEMIGKGVKYISIGRPTVQ